MSEPPHVAPNLGSRMNATIHGCDPIVAFPPKCMRPRWVSVRCRCFRSKVVTEKMREIPTKLDNSYSSCWIRLRNFIWKSILINFIYFQRIDYCVYCWQRVPYTRFGRRHQNSHLNEREDIPWISLLWKWVVWNVACQNIALKSAELVLGKFYA